MDLETLNACMTSSDCLFIKEVLSVLASLAKLLTLANPLFMVTLFIKGCRYIDL